MTDQSKGSVKFRYGVVKTEGEDEMGKLTDGIALLEMQMKWLEARKKISALDAQIKMHRLFEESLVCEMAELREKYEMCQARFEKERLEWLSDMRKSCICKAQKFENKDESKLSEKSVIKVNYSLCNLETHEFLIEEDRRLKLEEMNTRFGCNEPKLNCMKLLSSQQNAANLIKAGICHDKTAIEGMQSTSDRNGLRERVNLGTPVLGFSDTHNVYVFPVSSTNFCHTNALYLGLKSGYDGILISGESTSAQATSNKETVNEVELVEELTKKLEDANKKNSELLQALIIVDKQCEKLVELKIRLEKKDRIGASISFDSGILAQDCVSSGQTDMIVKENYSSVSSKHSINECTNTRHN